MVRVNTSMHMWDTYNMHIREKHPEFGRWDRRTSFYYAIPFIIIFGPELILTRFPQTYFVQVTEASLFGPMLVIPCIVLLLRWRGTHKFRKLWEEQLPVKPQL